MGPSPASARLDREPVASYTQSSVPVWSSLLRPELADLSPYIPAEPAGIRVRLDANEAPVHPSPVIREVVARALARTPLERYPDARARALKAQIAHRTGAPVEDLLVGAGSDEVISFLLTALARPRAPSPQPVVVTTTPTFVMYRVTARTHGFKVVEVPLDARWDLDVGAMRRAFELTRPNVVFVASPNNPTSGRMGDDRIAAVLESAPEAFVVVDEAYIDYAGASLRGWRDRFPNLGILRTLSKVGLAALRVGWLEGDAALVSEIDKVRQPFNLSATSQACAAAVLAEAWEEVQAHVGGVVRERERVSAALTGLAGVEVAPSAANFIWVKTPRPAAQVYEALAARGVLVRSFHATGGRLADRLRVTIGSPEDNDHFLDAMTSAVGAG